MARVPAVKVVQDADLCRTRATESAERGEEGARCVGSALCVGVAPTEEVGDPSALMMNMTAMSVEKISSVKRVARCMNLFRSTIAAMNM